MLLTVIIVTLTDVTYADTFYTNIEIPESAFLWYFTCIIPVQFVANLHLGSCYFHFCLQLITYDCTLLSIKLGYVYNYVCYSFSKPLVMSCVLIYVAVVIIKVQSCVDKNNLMLVYVCLN